jgi:hypothetical protein
MTTLENLNVYTPFTSSTSETFINDLKNFISGLDWFSNMDTTIEDVSVSGATRTNLNLLAGPLGLPSEKITFTLGLYYPNWEMYVLSNTTNIIGDRRLSSMYTANIFTLRTDKSSIIIIDTNTQYDFKYVFIGILKIKNIVTNAYENALLTGCRTDVFVSTKENSTSSILNIVNNYEYDISSSYIIKPLVYNNYVYDDLFIIYNGPTITDEVVKINDGIYLNIASHLFIKVN